jgi:hypothetical protein
LRRLAAIIAPLVSPLTTIGIVVIFVISILLQRQDLRNRFVRLAGSDLDQTEDSDPSFDAFSSREHASTSLENAPTASLHPPPLEEAGVGSVLLDVGGVALFG